MKAISKRGLALVAALFCAGALTAAAPPPAGPDVARVERYLNDIRSLKAEFIQVAPDGVVTEGKVTMERPGKLRFEYQPGVPILVVADGSTLTFVDYDVKQVTRWPISETPLGILVAKTINLTKALTVTTRHGEDGLLRVVVVDPKKTDQGYITLIFEDPPLTLRAWEVTDPQGYVTRVTLINPVTNADVPDKFFTYNDPRTLPFKKVGPR